ncbi:hypothetical protein KP509_15G055600 [Ceratopteris richardii]|nr:hypothetical protein KP509_15G055600 [Ceratopteris richardii]
MSKRGRAAAVSSSYSTVSTIKDGFTKTKIPHATKMSSVANGNKHDLKRSMHATENQNPNYATEGHHVRAKAAMAVPSFGAQTKKPKLTQSMHFSGKFDGSLSTCQTGRVQNKFDLDVKKRRASLGKKEPVLRKSTATREHGTDRSILPCHPSETKSRRAETTRMPFSVFSTSRSVMTSSLSFPSKRSMAPARSVQNMRRENEKSALRRPPVVVVRKDHKVAATNNNRDSAETTVTKFEIATANGSSCFVQKNGDGGSLQNGISDEGIGLPSIISNGDPGVCKEGGEGGKTNTITTDDEQMLAQITLEERLESLSLNTPGRELERALSVNEVSIRNATEASAQHEMTSASCTEKPQHDVCDVNPVFREDSSCYLNSTSVADVSYEVAICHSHTDDALASQDEFTANDEDSKINGSSVDISEGQQIASDAISEGQQDASDAIKENGKKGRIPQPLKDWRQNRGLKRKSSELNFKVNCSSKDHKHENRKVACSAVFGSSLLSHHVETGSSSRSPGKLPTLVSCQDSCKEQHKKIKTTKIQPFKPFRLRTEERGALKGLGNAIKEGESSQQERGGLKGESNQQVRQALKMPTFTHQFRPHRSTKKLTIPREPNFHSSRIRKTCTTSHHHAPMPTSLAN